MNKDGIVPPHFQRFLLHAAIQQDGLAINGNHLSPYVACAGTVQDQIGMLENMDQRWEAEDLAWHFTAVHFESRAHFQGCHPVLLGEHSSKFAGPSVSKFLEWAQARPPLVYGALVSKRLAAKAILAFHVDSFWDGTPELGQQLGEKEK